MGVRYRYQEDHEQFTVGAGGLKSGSLVNYLGKVWQYQGLQDAVQGEVVTLRKGIVVEIDKANPATVFAAGATVGYTAATQTAVAAGAGDFNVSGTARAASGAGVEVVLVNLIP